MISRATLNIRDSNSKKIDNRKEKITVILKQCPVRRCIVL